MKIPALRIARFVIPANAGIQLSLLPLIALLTHLPVAGAEQRSRAAGKGATV